MRHSNGLSSSSRLCGWNISTQWNALNQFIELVASSETSPRKAKRVVLLADHFLRLSRNNPSGLFGKGWNFASLLKIKFQERRLRLAHKNVPFYQANAPVHFSVIVVGKLIKFIFSTSSYLPGLAHSEYCFYSPL